MYGKVFESMYEGTLYGQWEAIVTMQQLIVLADSQGMVDLTPPAIAGKTSIPLEIIEKGLGILAAPDPYSRTPGLDGVRITLIDDHKPWGWFIVNHDKYNKMVKSAEKREADRIRIANKRKSLSDKGCRKVSQKVANVAQVEEEVEVTKEVKTYRAAKRVPAKWMCSDEGDQFALNVGMDEQTTHQEMAAFRDHEFKTARKDWDAAWRTWCRNWKKWRKDETHQKSNEFDSVHARNRKAAGLD